MFDNAMLGVRPGNADGARRFSKAQQYGFRAAGQVRWILLADPGHEMDAALIAEVSGQMAQGEWRVQLKLTRAQKRGRHITAAENGNVGILAEPFGKMETDPARPVGMARDDLLPNLEG